MAYWLVKTEPEDWSWENQSQAAGGISVWDGVRNAQAQQHMKSMKLGDLCFFYHSGKGKEVVGIVRVLKTLYPDETDTTRKLGAVDFQEVMPFKTRVTLAQMKEDEELKDFQMFSQPRLSVVPVSESVWLRVCKLGGIIAPKVSPDLESKEASNGAKKSASAVPKKSAVEDTPQKKVAPTPQKKIAPTPQKKVGSTPQKKTASTPQKKSGRGRKAAPKIDVHPEEVPAVEVEMKDEPTVGGKDVTKGLKKIAKPVSDDIVLATVRNNPSRKAKKDSSKVVTQKPAAASKKRPSAKSSATLKRQVRKKVS